MISVENLGGLERRMSFVVPEERIYSAVRERLGQLGQQTAIKGFRPGKAPFDVVERQLGPKVRDEVIGEVLMASFYEAARQENLRPAGLPEIELASRVAGLTASPASEFVATFEVYPEFELAPLEAVRIENPVSVIEDGDIDNVLASLQQMRTTWQPVQGPARSGDRILFDCWVLVGDEKQREIRQIPWILGAPAPGAEFGEAIQREFEIKLAQAKPGESIEMTADFPKDHQTAHLAGKTAQYQVKVTSVARPDCPTLDDDFARSMGIETGGIEALRAMTRSNMEQDRLAAARALLKRRTFEALLAHNPVELPKGRLQNECAHLCETTRAKLIEQGVKERDITLEPAHFEAQAQRHVATGILLAKITQDNQLEAPRERVQELLETLAGGYDSQEQFTAWYLQNPDLTAELESAVLEEVVVDWVAQRAQLIDEPIAFERLMKLWKGLEF